MPMMKPKEVVQYLKHDLWRIRLRDETRGRSMLLRTLRILVLAARGFDEKRCQLRASALTFFTLLSIVPILALAFGIAKGFGLERALEKQIREGFANQQEVVERMVEFSKRMLENAQGGLIAGIGLLLLVWTVIKVLGNIESSFNDIWGVKAGRTLGRKFSDYLAFMFISPILLAVSSSVTVIVGSRLSSILGDAKFLGAFAPAVLGGLKVVSWGVIWALFTWVYYFMPNTRVRVKSALVGGVLAGAIYQITQWIYVHFQVGAAKYGAIYGSFAALPLFLVWLQTSWLILLFGAEISFAHQNVDTYEFEPDCEKLSPRYRRLAALRVMHALVVRFRDHRDPATAPVISQELDVPIRLIHEVLFELTDAKLVCEVKTADEREPAYQPAQPLEDLRVASVLAALDSRGTSTLHLGETPEVKQLAASLATFEDAAKNSEANKALSAV